MSEPLHGRDLSRRSSRSRSLTPVAACDNETLRVFARSLRTGSFFWPVKLPQVTVMRSMAILALLVALSTTADAHHLPTNHLRHSFAWNVHRQASVVQHRKVSSVSVQQDVDTRPLVTANVCAPLIWRARTGLFHWVQSSMSPMNGPRDLF